MYLYHHLNHPEEDTTTYTPILRKNPNQADKTPIFVLAGLFVSDNVTRKPKAK